MVSIFSKKNLAQSKTQPYNFLIFVTGLSIGAQTMDVLESENVLLDCRFPTGLSNQELVLYWIRSNRNGHDNVAIKELILENNYG